MLEIADSIEPGASLFRARILLDRQDAQTHQTRRQFADKAISAVVAHVNFTQFLITFTSVSHPSLSFSLSFICLLQQRRSHTQEQFNEQLDELSEADNIFGTDAIMQPIVRERMKQINANIQQLKLPR